MFSRLSWFKYEISIVSDGKKGDTSIRLMYSFVLDDNCSMWIGWQVKSFRHHLKESPTVKTTTFRIINRKTHRTTSIYKLLPASVFQTQPKNIQNSILSCVSVTVSNFNHFVPPWMVKVLLPTLLAINEVTNQKNDRFKLRLDEFWFKTFDACCRFSGGIL
jgi:hypothetical protein